eukprot:360874-Chlamydomonas_euryale.AAC.20
MDASHLFTEYTSPSCLDYLVARRRVLDLIEAVQRGGLAAPWQAMAPLVALAVDPCPTTATKSLRVVKQARRIHVVQHA